MPTCLEHVCRIPLRMSEEDMLIGDDAIHGEAAYVFGPCEAHEQGYIQGEVVRTGTDADAELGIGGIHAVHEEPKESKNGESSHA